MEEKGSKILQYVILIAIIALMIGGSVYANRFFDSTDGSSQRLLNLGISFVAMLIGLYVNIILHEIGHLIGGLRSGYRFVAFNVFRSTVKKENGKLKVKRCRFPGAMGGCILSPPDMNDGKYPFKLTTCFGFLVNFLIGAVCFILLFSIAGISGFAAVVLLFTGIWGIGLGVLNLVPINTILPNDGYIFFHMGKEENASMRRGFWSGNRVQILDTEGVRPRDIPTELFDWVDKDNVKDVFTLGTAGIQYKYYLDGRELDRARALMQSLCNNSSNIPKVQMDSGYCDLLFQEMVNECREGAIDRLYTKGVKDFMSIARSEMNVQRTLYAHALLVLKDPVKAKKHLSLFQRACASSIWSGTAIMELELIALVDEIASERGVSL